MEKKWYNLLKKEWKNINHPVIIETGKVWYKKEHEYCRELENRYNIPLFKVTALFACFSPLKSVKENKKILENYLEGNKYGHTSLQMQKADKIYLSKNERNIDSILNGIKTINFYHNLYNPEDKEWVTNDRHNINFFSKGVGFLITPKRYNAMTNVIKQFSEEVDLVPCELQASIWLWSKQKYGNNV